MSSPPPPPPPPPSPPPAGPRPAGPQSATPPPGAAEPDPTFAHAASGATAPVDQELLRALLEYLAFLQQYTSLDELGYYLHGIERRTVPLGQLIFAQGAPVEKIFVLIAGQVQEVRAHSQRLATGVAGPVAPPTPAVGQSPAPAEALPLRTVDTPTLLGLFDLVHGKAHSSSARAITDCDLIVLDAAQVNRLLYRYPDLRTTMLPAARMERLRTMPLLATVDSVAIAYVADAARVRTYLAGDTIYQAGESADQVYLIDEGQVRLDYSDVGDVHSVWMGNGGDFGYAARPPASSGNVYTLEHNAVAVSVVRVLVVPRQSFFAATAVAPEVEGEKLRKLRASTLDHLGVFSAWSPEQRAHLLGYMSHYYLPNSHLLTQQGDMADSLWVLLPGGRAIAHTVAFNGVAQPDVQLKGPSYFNEEAIREQTPAASTLEAQPGSSWLRLQWQDFSVFLERAGRPELSAQLHLQRQAATPASDRSHKRFRWLSADEQILLEVRRHWIVALAKIAPAIVLSVLLGWLLVGLIELEVLRLWAWIGAGLLALLTLATWWWAIVDYSNDYLIVTNLRVVRQEKIVLLHQSVQAAPLEKIQDVNLKQDVWGSYLHFGDLEVQTPGPGGNIKFDRVADFARVSQTITQARDARRRHYQATGKKLIYQTLENRFGGALAIPSRVLALLPPTPAAAAAAVAAAPTGFVWLARLTGQATRTNPLTGKGAATSGPASAPIPASPGAPPAKVSERIVWHKHWIVLVGVATLPSILVIAATVLAAFFHWSGMGGPLVAVSIFAALIGGGWLWWNIADWYNDIYILDNEQLIDIERTPLGISNQQRTAGLRQIVDLRLDVPSPIHYLLNFGNVFVQTAAQDGEFSFLNVRDPAGVMETIRRRLDQARVDEERQAARQRAQEFPDWLEVYSRLDRRQAEADSAEQSTLQDVDEP